VTLASGASYDGSVAAGSPELEPGQTYRLTFTQPGDYPCVCLIHSAPNNQVMRGLVRVMPAGSPRPRLPANLRQLADEARRTLLVHGRRMRARAAQMVHGQGQNDRRVVGVGIDDGREVAVLRFFPSVLTVHTGEWVHFELLQGDHTLPPAAPHTVTFGQEPPEDALFVPSGDPTNYQGGALHSGFLWATPPPGLPPLPTSFDARFTKAGVFPYICALHDEAGMRGAIVVTD
jgi:plastocyanin